MSRINSARNEMQRKKIFSFILPNVWQLGHFRRESLVCFVQRFWSDGGNVDENHQCYSKIQNSSRVYEKELGARVTWLWVAITYCKIALQLCKSTKTFWERSIETIFVAASLLIFCSCIDLSAQARAHVSEACFGWGGARSTSSSSGSLPGTGPRPSTRPTAGLTGTGTTSGFRGARHGQTIRLLLQRED